MPKYPVNDRKCEDCGERVPPGTPRRTSDGQLVCSKCFTRRSAMTLYRQAAEQYPTSEPVAPSRPDWRQDAARARTAALVKRAHDSGNQVDIYHCPFCGSGQVVGRSDRTVECTFCNAVFTVQVQPMYSGVPQTIDGESVEEPGAPGMDGEPDVAGDEMLPEEQGTMNGQLPPEEDADQDGEPDDEEGDDEPAFLKGSMLRTANGTPVPIPDLINHMALLQATDEERPAILARIREERAR
jgi:ribosomal protein L37AE/L43A